MIIEGEEMFNKIIILGAGGMARELYFMYVDSSREDLIKGFLVNKSHKSTVKVDKPIFEFEKVEQDSFYINGIGSPLRKKWISEIEREEGKFESIFHPTAVIGKDNMLGHDLVICANSIITCNIRVGNHVIINSGSTISHDSIVGDYSTISPGVNIGGGVSIGEGCFIGIGSSIVQNVSIGRGVFIGAGSVVVDNIPDNSLAYGNPAKVIRKLSDSDWEELI